MENKPINTDEKSLVSLIIENVKGSLSKVAAYCADNNMNIERLVLSNFKTNNKQHRIIMYISGDRTKIDHLVNNLKKLNVVIKVTNFQASKYLERELMLVKIKTDSKYSSMVSDLANNYGGRTILVNDEVIIFQFTNDENTNNELMQKLENISDDIEILKSGVVATSLDTKIVQ